MDSHLYHRKGHQVNCGKKNTDLFGSYIIGNLYDLVQILFLVMSNTLLMIRICVLSLYSYSGVC